MSTIRPEDRVSLCRFTFADGRKCLTPRAPNHPHFCYFHARRESRSTGTDKLARDLAFFLSGEYLSANDLSAALGRVLPAVVRGDLKPRAAGIVAYIAQTLAQTIHLAQDEYINAFSTDDWRDTIRHCVDQNFDYRHPSPPPQPQPTDPPESDPAPTSPRQPPEPESSTSECDQEHVGAGL
jgi:hypothetical protein